ncbi:glycoside hydrolase family 3 C-terminal domain-containing protein [Mangrovibacterium marinum]|uniref:Beta-glucosidase n=1 Tax=Mangrovibacterium marinum TaxID=1639118 RepID=A0A2T5C4I0_9BACT|nr:glycoside hydrolase family 3 C-terminal domain-containing protein [Mangrovibacterium marinum]PTN09785.1 beta-glucosidase [Mangrovibacterium marinum]
MKKSLLILALAVFSQIGFAQVQLSEDEIEQKIDEIIPQLSLKEKVAMCHAQSKFSSPGVPRLGIPEIWMADGPHGVRAEINWDDWGHAGWTNDSVTAFPALTCLAASFNPEVAMQYGNALGEEARFRRKDIMLAPGVNIYRTPLNGRNFEYLGEDPYLVSTMVVPYIKGIQSNGVSACVKHFALNNQEEWRGHIDVQVDDRALREIYLPAFKAAVTEAGVWTLMGAYNKYKGQYTTTNKVLINDILKGEWGFDGVVVSDWGSAHDTDEAALNGLDLEMGSWTNGLTASRDFAYNEYYLADAFYAKLKSGEIPESVVDDKVRRILRLMFRTSMNTARGFGSQNSEQHQQVARKVATEGMVLLKNEDHFFPIDPATTKTIAVIGENATKMMTLGGGSSELKAQYEISPLEGIQKRFSNAKILHTLGYSSGPSWYGRVIEPKENQDSLYQAALETARQADLVLFVGGLNKNHHQDCEAGDRLSYNLPFNQDALLQDIVKINPNTAVILVSGNAVAVPWLNDVKALLQAWYLGSETGNAIADLLSGEVNPSGKLPFSFPVKLEDNAAHSFGKLSYPGDSIKQYYKEGILVGYRWFDTKQIKPQFPFGYGLSYTSFAYNDLKTDKKAYTTNDSVEVSFTLKNTGDVAGAEVAQLYVSDPKCSVMRPAKELKAFKKVFLQPGEEKEVSLSVPASSFAYYSEETKGWVVEPGKFILQINSSSADNQLKTTIEVN